MTVLSELGPGELWSFLPRGYLFSIAIETPVLLIGLSRPHSWRVRLAAGIWLTACSYPIVVLVLPPLLGVESWLYLAVAEIFAPVAECALFSAAFHASAIRRSDRVHDWIAIVLANLASFLIGMWLTKSGWLNV